MIKKKFISIMVLEETRDDLRKIAKIEDKNIYKIVRNMVDKEKLFLSKNNV